MVSSKRGLPERKNPLLEPTESTAIEILVERRRLGQTNLNVKPGIAGVTSATKPENMGPFDYAHLRIPLPKDLTGSGIFSLTRTSAYPDSYYLMRRSSDGYISATGMFKVAFPWASLAEEEAERKYQKTFPSAGPEEIAGSVWIAPEEALALADEYSIRHWVEALLDPQPIEKGTKEKSNPSIQMPPVFNLEDAIPALLPSYPGARSTRARSVRSASPSKIATPARKLATPRKPRTTRSALKPEVAKAEGIFDSFSKATTPSTAIQDFIANGASPGPVVSVVSESLDEDVKEGEHNHDEVKEGTVRIEVQETVETNGNIETTTTNVKIDVPHSHAELPEPEDPAKMIEEAKRMVAEAQKLEASSSGDISKSSKRKVEEVIDETELAAERPNKAAKVATPIEQKLAKEKITRRALAGIFAMGAISAAVQYFAA